MFDTFFVLVYPYIFILGVALGSYANAWMWRVHEGLWRFGGRSQCVGCARQLRWFENIPLFSFLFLKGKCRTCHIRIPISYFFVELLTGLLFIVLAYFHTEIITFNVWEFVRNLIFAVLLMIVFVYDLKYMLILPSIVWSGSVIAFAINFFALHYSVLSLFWGGVVGGGFFWLQYVVSKGRWIGGGDVRLGVMMGLLLGLSNVLVALFISYVLGAVVSIILLVRRSKDMQSAIPFGTFLAIGTGVALIFGPSIVAWYLSLLY